MVQRKLTTQEELDTMLAQLQQQQTQGIQAGAKRSLKKKNRKTRNIAFILLIVFLTAVLTGILVTKANGGTPNILGYYLFIVQTSSMDPTLPAGTVILSKKPSDPAALAEDTIITFQTLDGRRVTHRIINVKKENNKVMYVTKGDNPINSPDPDLLDPDRIEAVYVCKLPSL